MCRVASPSHFPSPVIVVFLLGLLTFPASAQTSSDPNTPSTGTAGARAQSELTGGPADLNPATAKSDSNATTTTTNSPAAKAESEPGSSQPQFNPEPKKVGSTILININKAKQK